MKEAIERIARLKESDIGPSEENVKQKVIVPILELLGHKRESLEFEYPTRRGGKMDIFIKNVPPDCKVIIDTKNYNENLSDHIEQIKEYTFAEDPLLTVIANGTEIRIYSQLKGIAFERSLLYSIKKQDLSEESVWSILSDLLHIENLQSRNVLRKIEEREREIRDAMTKEYHLKQEYDKKIEGINSDIEIKEEEIGQLRKGKESLAEELKTEKSKIWSTLELPSDPFMSSSATFSGGRTTKPPIEGKDGRKPAGRVTFQDLIAEGLVRDGQTLYFYYKRLFQDEQAVIIAASNKLKYKNVHYSVSDLAQELIVKHGGRQQPHGVQGPKFWKNEDGLLLDDLNEQVRAKRGDRK